MWSAHKKSPIPLGKDSESTETLHKAPGFSTRRGSLWQRLRPKHMPIAIKLAITIGILLTIAMASLGSLIVHNQTQLLNDQIHSTGRTVVSQMAESAKEPLLAKDTLQLELLAYNLAASENVLGTAIYSANLEIQARYGRSPFEPYAPHAEQRKNFLDGSGHTLQWTWPYSPQGYLDAVSFMAPITFKDVIVGHVLITFSRESMTRAITRSVQSIIAATALLILVGIFISYWMAKRLTRPIQHLLDASRAIDSGHFNIHLGDQRNDEIGILMTSLGNMAEGLLQKQQVEDAFARHVSPTVAREILRNLDEVKLGGKHALGSVVFIDIVGFTAKSETMTPQAVAEWLSEFYSYINHTVPLFNGTIDKFIGDCAMVVFGVPEVDEEHVYNAISYAIFLQRLTERINQRRTARGKFPVRFRIGMNCGEMLAGNMGSVKRMQYTVVGDSVNLASRLCSAAHADQILITEETYNLPGIRDRIIASQYQSMRVRGKSKPIHTYLVHDVAEAEQLHMEQMINGLLNSLRKEIA